MSIPFKDLAGVEPTATAGYLKFLPWATKDTWLGALFIINARGEPLEFAHARVCSPNRLLWRADLLEMRCQASLTASLLKACPAMPALILCLSNELCPSLFGEYLRMEPPVVRVAQDERSEDVAAKWVSEPDPVSPSGSLFKLLSTRRLLLEPFERAEAGLRQVYSELLKR